MSWRARRKVTYYAKCSCGRTYTRKAWRALPSLGTMRIPADHLGPESNVEMRNCICGSTMGVEKGPTVSRDPKERFLVTIRYMREGHVQHLTIILFADSAEQAKRFSHMRLPKGSRLIGATVKRLPATGERDPHSRLLYQGVWPSNLRSEKRSYKAVWFPEEKTVIIYERSVSNFKTKMRGKRIQIIPTPGEGLKWKTWGTYKLSEFHGDMKELLRVVRSDIRYESLAPGKREAIDNAKERERGTRVALMGRKKAINKFGKLLRRAERIAEAASEQNTLEKARLAWESAGRILDGFGETDRETKYLAKDWTMVGRVIARAHRRIGGTERDPKRFRKSSKAFRARVPDRKPDKCFVYHSKKGFNVTCAWASRRASRNFKTEKLAMKFARSLRCKVYKGSEFSRLSKATKQEIYKKVPILMKQEGFPRGQAFAVAVSMALRGTLKRVKAGAKKKTPTQKKRAKMKKSKKRSK